MSNYDAWEFSKKCNFYEGGENKESSFDLAFIAVNANKPMSIRSKADLHRFEFLEFIARIAFYKYKQPKICNSMSSAIEMLISKDILKNTQVLDPFAFRKKLYTYHCNEFYVKNEQSIWKIYLS